MGREVRMVPPDWQHPKDERGRYIPLFDGATLHQEIADWDEAAKKWDEGFIATYSDKGKEWKPKSESRDTEGCNSYAEFAGERPNPADYMPSWPDDQRTHFMMYETTSEGTPISPAFATAEELARWLSDNNASAFASMTASYEAWLATIRRGSAPTAMFSPKTGEWKSGVEWNL